jgi:sulfate permease, SulP family
MRLFRDGRGRKSSRTHHLPLLNVNLSLRRRWRELGNVNGGLFVALGLFASDIGYGYIAYAPLGHDYANTGIIAAFLASMLGSLIPAFIRGSAPMFGGPRPAQTLIFAALLGTVAASSGQDSALLVPVAAMACVSLAGMIQIAFGLLGLGRIIRFTPVPVLAGFTNGVALSMILSALMIILDAEHALGQPASAETRA